MTCTFSEVAADVESLLHTPLFRGVDHDALRRIAADAESLSLHGGDYLFRGGDPADRLYIVRTGRLGVVVEGADGPRIVRELGPGDVLDELAPSPDHPGRRRRGPSATAS